MSALPGSSPAGTSDVGRELLEFLRTATGHDAISLANPLHRLTGGFDTEVFAFQLENAPAALSGPLVLRLHRHPGESRKARIETAIHVTASASGHPVPAVPVDAAGYTIRGRPFMLMERARGRSLL